MPKPFTDRIIEFLSRPAYRPTKVSKLARAMGVADAEYGDFHDAVDALRRVGRVILGTGHALMLPAVPKHVIGTYRGNPRGFGFVVPDDPTEHGDLYIAEGDRLDAVTGDRVQCEFVRRGRRLGKESFGGRIIKVVERGNNRFVGQLRQEGGFWFVQPDGNTLHVPIMVDDVGAKGARLGDQVVVEIVRYPSAGKSAKGVIVERIGKQGELGVDLRSIIRQYQLPEAFPKSVLDETRTVARQCDFEKPPGSREDITSLLTITIDPDDARDFDDAISLVRLKTQASSLKPHVARPPAWELGVHIADVSAFVRPNKALDKEARQRGTSVYLPGRVIPMLPELLSNGLCSLQEGEPRWTKSAFIRYDSAGNVVGARFANTTIRSTKRLTYLEAQAILDGKKSAPREIAGLLRDMDSLARTIQKRRIADGMITLDLPDVRLVFDDQERVVDAQPEDDSFTHTIIEMFMVEANEAVARLLFKLGLPFIRRIHEPPSEEALETMVRFLRAAGFSAPRTLGPRDLQQLLAPLKGRPEAYAVNLAVLKSMQLAEYSPRSVGHFALASKAYAHFTSPIRRYADLTIHRLLDLHVNGRLKGRGKASRDDVPSHETCVELSRHLSYVSRRAESAERELKTLKVLQLLSDHVGDDFEGVITGVTNFGMFVQHPKYLVDGLLRVEDLGDDWWDVDVASGRVVGQRSRRSFALGSVVRVRIARIDLAARQMGLALVAGGLSGTGRAASRKGRDRPPRRREAHPRGRSGRHGRR